MKKLLITGAWKYKESEYKELAQMGYDICFVQNEQDSLPMEAFDAEVVICNGLFMYHDIQLFKKLKKIQLTSAGFDRVSMTYINEKGIEIYNAKGVYSKPMAEFAIGGVLQIYKQSRFFSENQKKHYWEKHRGLWELSDKTVCIIGCGSVGSECAKRFSAFECRVVGVDLYPSENAYFERIVGMEQLDETLQYADIVILSLPLTKETHHIIDEKRFALMKSKVVLVNISRGQTVDTQAMIKYLPQLGGAVLDVFEEEPLLETSALWDMENVIITPHNSFVGEMNNERLNEIIMRNMLNWSS